MEDFEDKKRDWKFEWLRPFRAMAEVTIGVRAEGIMDRFGLVGYRGQKALKSWGPHGRDIDKQTGLATSTLLSWSVNSCVSYFLEGHYPGGPVSTLLWMVRC